MVYKTCKECGANLDPEERCECQKESTREVAASKRVHIQNYNFNIAQNKEEHKYGKNCFKENKARRI